jgi:Xaa-Pro aminopeptidase
MDYRGRHRHLQGLLGANRLDGLLLTHLPNIRYLCGFTGSAGVLAVTETNTNFFTDTRYTIQAGLEVQGARVIAGRKNPLIAAAEWLKSHYRGLRLGIEGEHLSVAAQARLKAALSGKFRLKQAPPLVERARMVKDPDELNRMRAAALLGVGLLDSLQSVLRPGVRECEVAAELEHAASRAGAEAMSFSTIIASGERSALPHGRASQQPVPARGFVVCDFGVILAGYCSDMTRTLSMGRAGEVPRQAYEAVREAQQAAVDFVRAGRSVGEIDQAARKSLQKKRLGRYFTHSTGHGVGLEIHEAPRLAAQGAEILQPGMVVTIEPGVYLPGKFGIRIEDTVVVTERGCEVLTPASKELIEL